MADSAEHSPEMIFVTAWIIQLGIIEPSASFSLIYPIAHAIRPVKTINTRALPAPASAINNAPCSSPNNNACMAFPIPNPNLLESPF